MKKVPPRWLLALLLAVCFTLATLFVPRAAWWNVCRALPIGNRPVTIGERLQIAVWRRAEAVCQRIFRHGRRVFSQRLLPSIFDQQETDHDVAEPAQGKAEDEDSTSDDFLGPPPDWIAALDRHFVPNRHTHLNSGGPTGDKKASERAGNSAVAETGHRHEPANDRAYRVGYYWLRRLHKPAEARDFLFEGLRNNPGNSELLFDLGWLYKENFHDTNRARNVWKAGLRCWEAQSDNAKQAPRPIGLR